MKNLILGAASVLAISVAFAANAQTSNSASPSGPASKPTAPAPAPLLAPGTPPGKTIAPAPTAPLQKLATPMTGAAEPVVSPPCQAPKHQAHKPPHHKPHHKPHHMAPMQELYITFPPAQGCNLEYYWGTAAYPYVYHGGYFWYPQAQANVLAGYNPAYWNGAYWYASRMHPHMLYIEGQGASYVVPLDTRVQR